MTTHDQITSKTALAGLVMEAYKNIGGVIHGFCHSIRDRLQPLKALLTLQTPLDAWTPPKEGGRTAGMTTDSRFQGIAAIAICD
jgi:hypothetical protein